MKKSIVFVGILAFSVYHLLFKSTVPGKVFMDGEYVYTSGIVYERVWDAYDELPEKVEDMLEDNNYRIHVVDLIDNDECIMGQTIFGSRLILMKNENYRVERTFFHECGHVLDDEMAFTFISRSDEFNAIYEEEKGDFRVDDNYDYFVSTPAEYFASAFSEYMIRPKRLEYNTPKTYEFIERCLQ